MKYNIFIMDDTTTWLCNDGFGISRKVRREFGADRAIYHAHLVIEINKGVSKIYKNHTRFTDEEVKIRTNNLEDLDRINGYSKYLLIK
jgi:hypothetical protein